MPVDKTPWTDETIMPWGDHRGLLLKDVPASYKAWLLEQRHWLPDWPGLDSYLQRHKDEILKEAEGTFSETGEKEGYDDYEDYRRDTRR